MALVGAFLGPASTPQGLSDLWQTLASGAWMLDNQRLLTEDPFTSAPPDPTWLNQQWLAQLVTGIMYRLGGLELVTVVHALLVSLAFGLVLATSTRTSGDIRLAFASTAVAYVIGASNLTIRPQTLAYPIFAAFLLVVTRAHWGGSTRWFWALPPLMLVWANVHGSFVLGLLLLGCGGMAAGIELRRVSAVGPYVAAFVLCLVAATLTPWAAASFGYVVALGSNPIIRGSVTEWWPTSLAYREGAVFFASAMLLVALLAATRARLRPFEWLVLGSFALVGLSAIRSVIWWGLVLAPVLARLLAVGTRRWVRPPGAAATAPAVNAAILLALGLLTLISLPWVKGLNPALPSPKAGALTDEVPVRAAEFLKRQPGPGVMLNYQPWGGYLEWTLWPARRPFVDGRIELHPPSVWRDYFAATYPSADWESLLARYGVGTLVLSVEQNARLIQTALQSARWRVAYADDQAVVLVRNASG